MVTKILVTKYSSPLQTHEEGSKVYHLIRDSFVKGQPVELSFEGVDSVTSTFINTAIVLLLDEYQIDEIKKNLKIIKTNSQINKMISYCLETGLQKKEIQGTPTSLTIPPSHQ